MYCSAQNVIRSQERPWQRGERHPFGENVFFGRDRPSGASARMRQSENSCIRAEEYIPNFEHFRKSPPRPGQPFAADSICTVFCAQWRGRFTYLPCSPLEPQVCRPSGSQPERRKTGRCPARHGIVQPAGDVLRTESIDGNKMGLGFGSA